MILVFFAEDVLKLFLFVWIDFRLEIVLDVLSKHLNLLHFGSISTSISLLLLLFLDSFIENTLVRDFITALCHLPLSLS